MTLELTEREISDIKIAITDVIINFRHEIADKDTTQSRREICERSLNKWLRLKEKIKSQTEAQ